MALTQNLLCRYNIWLCHLSNEYCLMSGTGQDTYFGDGDNMIRTKCCVIHDSRYVADDIPDENQEELIVGDLVARSVSAKTFIRENRKFKKGWRDIANAATFLSGHGVYAVKGFTKNGGVRLEGFLLTVSRKNLRKVAAKGQGHRLWSYPP